MNGGPSGFHNAPATKAFLLASAVITIAFGVQERSLRLGLSYQDLSENFHIWRIFTSVFAFSSTPKLMFGLCLLYYFRVFERQIRSNKYTILPEAYLHLDLMVLYFLHLCPFISISLLHHGSAYLAYTSVISHSYIWQAFRSIIPGICGLFAGFLYYMNAFGIRSIKSVASFFSRFFSSSLASSSRISSSGNIMGNISPYVGRPVQRSYPSTAHSRAPPSEASIATLVSMGFDRNAVRQALIQAGNDINVATNILLEASSR